MVNMTLMSGVKLSVSFVTNTRTFGGKGIRQVVECDVYLVEDEMMSFYSKGMAILNPLDKFDATVGARKALASAVCGMPREERKHVQDQMTEWF